MPLPNPPMFRPSLPEKASPVPPERLARMWLSVPAVRRSSSTTQTSPGPTCRPRKERGTRRTMKSTTSGLSRSVDTCTARVATKDVAEPRARLPTSALGRARTRLYATSQIASRRCPARWPGSVSFSEAGTFTNISLWVHGRIGFGLYHLLSGEGLYGQVT